MPKQTPDSSSGRRPTGCLYDRILAAALGLLVGWAVAWAVLHRWSSGPASHHDIFGQAEASFHGECVLLDEDAVVEIAKRELREPTIRYVERFLARDTARDVEVLTVFPYGPSGLNASLAVDGDEPHVWQFVVDHMTGSITHVTRRIEMSESGAVGAVRRAFEEKRHADIRDGGPAPGSRITVKTVEYYGLKGWGVVVTAEGQEGGWAIGVTPEGEIKHAHHLVH